MAKSSMVAQLVALIVAVAGLSVLPLYLDDYLLHWAVTVLMYVVIALAWDLLARSGQSSFGQTGFFGVGAYLSSLLSSALHFNPILAILLASIGVGAVAAVCGRLFLRVRGIYFAILTLALAEVFKVLATQLEGITGGAMGLTMRPLFNGSIVDSYFFVLAAAVASVTGIAWMERSKLNFGITAIRSSPEVASAFGVPVNAIRVGVFTVSAMATGMMGGFYAFYTSYINPENVFDTSISVAPVIMCIFGGLYTIAGPIIGAVTLILLQEGLRTVIESGSLVIYGLLLIGSVLFMPQGVWGLWCWAFRKLRPAQDTGDGRGEPLHAAHR
jgi:branched-chain amino acid transport system permease protein